MRIDDAKPMMMSLEETERQISNQGYSFNEAGQSFNQAGVTFGGLYGNEGQKPTMNIYDYKP
jgi:hypothetical protein